MTAPGPPAGPPPTEVSDAVLAYHLGRPDVIRQRAQHAAAIAGAAAAVLAAAGGFAALYRYPKPIEGLLVLAIVAWLVTVGFYMHVVGKHVVPVEAFSEDGTLRPDLLTAVGENAEQVRASLKTAQWVGRGALGLTIAAIVVAVWHAEARDESVLSRIVVSEELAVAIGVACGPGSELQRGRRNFRAEVRLDDLDAAFVELQIRDGRCRGEDEQVKMRVPTDGILTTAPVGS